MYKLKTYRIINHTLKWRYEIGSYNKLKTYRLLNPFSFFITFLIIFVMIVE